MWIRLWGKVLCQAINPLLINAYKTLSKCSVNYGTPHRSIIAWTGMCAWCNPSKNTLRCGFRCNAYASRMEPQVSTKTNTLNVCSEHLILLALLRRRTGTLVIPCGSPQIFSSLGWCNQPWTGGLAVLLFSFASSGHRAEMHCNHIVIAVGRTRLLLYQMNKRCCAYLSLDQFFKHWNTRKSGNNLGHHTFSSFINLTM